MAQNNTSPTSAPRTHHDTTATIPNPTQQPASAVQWESPAIFYENHSNPSHSSAPAHAQEVFPTEPADSPSVLQVPMCPDVSVEPIYRQHRSLSFSMGEEPGLFGYNEYYEEYEHSLDTMAEEDEAEDDEAGRRTRSKSSGAALSRLSAAQQDHLQRMSSTQMHSSTSNSDDTIHTHHAMPNTQSHFPPSSPSSSSAGVESAVSVSDPRANQEMGKGVPLHRLPPQAPLYMLEFKAGRTDFFYAPAGVHVQLGDLAIVEADRGKDLGKVVMLLGSDQVLAMGIQKHQQQQQQQQHQEGADDAAPLTKADIYIKRIYRPASGDEIHLLLSKAHDEQKALAMCQQKTRQRKLPMEVVDAEYQWDRRKLTFYFVADRRIDFRELVRELFKIYKTRIWMCAVNSA